MQNLCLKCGKQLFDGNQLCPECQSADIGTDRPFAESPPPEIETQSQFSARPGTVAPVEIYGQPAAVSTACPYCGGAGGVFTKSTISSGGFIYMGIMLLLTVGAFVIFFPCAIIPFALLFLGLLFKEKHLACVNCSQNLS